MGGGGGQLSPVATAMSSGKHNYTLYINYHKWTRNRKNNILLLQDVHMVSEKHGEKMGTFLQRYRHFIKI